MNNSLVQQTYKMLLRAKCVQPKGPCDAIVNHYYMTLKYHNYSICSSAVLTTNNSVGKYKVF